MTLPLQNPRSGVRIGVREALGLFAFTRNGMLPANHLIGKTVPQTNPSIKIGNVRATSPVLLCHTLCRVPEPKVLTINAPPLGTVHEGELRSKYEAVASES